MRLRDLDARFVTEVTATGSRHTESDALEGAQGVMFQCPKCAEGHYIQVLFSNPIGVEAAPPDAGVTGADHKSHPRWSIESGSSLDDLTLAPSINCDIPSPDGSPSICKFHGYVRSGEAS